MEQKLNHIEDDEFLSERLSDDENAMADRLELLRENGVECGNGMPDSMAEDLRLMAVESRVERMRPEVENRLAEFHRSKKIPYYWWKKYKLVAATVVTASILLVFFLHKVLFSGGATGDWVAFVPDSIPAQVTLETDRGGRKSVIDWSVLVPAYSQANELDYCAMDKLVMPEKGMNEHHTLTVPCGETFKITLADGTEVQLNAGTRLTYPVRFIGNERVVRLEGEAYFKVAKNTGCPFIVQTDRLSVRVLGTEFNVMAYPDAMQEVILYEGSVEYRDMQSDSVWRRMTPGQSVRLESASNSSLKMSATDLETDYSWRNGYFYYDDIRLEEIMQNVGRWYGVPVVFHNREALDLRMHYVAGRQEGLEKVIELLNRMKKAKISVTENGIVVE